LKTSLLKFKVDTMTWLTVTEYLCYGYVTRIHNHIRSSFMTYHRVCSECNDFLFLLWYLQMYIWNVLLYDWPSI